MMEQIIGIKRVFLLDQYDLSNGDKTIAVSFVGHPKITLQAIWSAVSGTGIAISMQQSSNGVDWDTMQTVGDSGLKNWGINIASESGSSTIQDDEQFGGNYLRMVVTCDTISAGYLSLILNVY